MFRWSLLIWVFFPIPFLSLVLMSIPGPARFAKIGNAIVHKIFFTRISIGLFQVRLLDFFILSSILIFLSCVHTVTMKPVSCVSCRFETETYWYKKAMKFRAERNFWLSLFNVFLWFLVWRIHSMKGIIIKNKDVIEEVKAELKCAQDDNVRIQVELTKSKDEKKKE